MKVNESKLIRRYANAFVLAIADESEYQRMQQELREFLRLYESTEQLRLVLLSFMVPLPRRREVLDAVIERSQLSPKIGRFLNILLEESRFPLLQHIIEQLEPVWFESRGIEKVVAFSVIPLSEDEKRCLAANLAKSFHGQVVLENRLNPDLIGGIKIQRGSDFYDFSLAGNMARLRKKIIEEK